MELTLIAYALTLTGILLLGWLKPVAQSGLNRMAAVPTAVPDTTQHLVGKVLAAPYQVLRSPVGSRVVRTYFNEGQTMPSKALLLKLVVGAGSSAQAVFVTAPAAGDPSRMQVSEGQYVAAGVPYARLTSRAPVRVRVSAVEAAHLRLGDSLRARWAWFGTLLPSPPLYRTPRGTQWCWCWAIWAGRPARRFRWCWCLCHPICR